ncbi:MAG TPA: hypothetical protein VND62_03615 [Acidimicrobiales bacterium]|nr:hypothetical protein [Acidimicrobiales bacterium]
MPRSSDRLAAVTVEVEGVPAVRTAPQSRARLVQDGVSCVEALVTTGLLDPASAPRWARASSVVGGRADERCLDLDGPGRVVAQATQLAGIRLA